jgi:hypothetical protein
MKFSKLICQSCATPIRKDMEKGTERKGGFSEIFCRRCYQSGVFTDPKMTMEMMHESVRLKMIEMQFPRFLAVLLANKVYALKRWETEAVKV